MEGGNKLNSSYESALSTYQRTSPLLAQFTLRATMLGRSQGFHFTDEKTKAQLRGGQWLVVVLSDLMTFLLPLQVTEHSKAGAMRQVVCLLEADELGIWDLGSSHPIYRGNPHQAATLPANAACQNFSPE